MENLDFYKNCITLEDDEKIINNLLEALNEGENLSKGLELKRQSLLYKKRTLPMVLDAVKEVDLQQREYCRALQQYQI